MSLSAVRPYFRARMNVLGYTEWTDGFAFDNIPQSIIDGAYHIESETISSQAANQLGHGFIYPVMVRVFIKGYRDPASAIDSAIAQSELILAEVLDPANRLGVSIKDVTPNSVSVAPLSASDDNDIILELNFNAVIYCDFS